MEVEGNGYMIGRTQASRCMNGIPWYFLPLLFLFSRNFYYFLMDVGRIVKRRMKWIGEWRKMTYEKVGLRGWSGWEEDMVDGC